MRFRRKIGQFTKSIGAASLLGLTLISDFRESHGCQPFIGAVNLVKSFKPRIQKQSANLVALEINSLDFDGGADGTYSVALVDRPKEEILALSLDPSKANKSAALLTNPIGNESLISDLLRNKSAPTSGVYSPGKVRENGAFDSLYFEFVGNYLFIVGFTNCPSEPAR